MPAQLVRFATTAGAPIYVKPREVAAIVDTDADGTDDDPISSDLILHGGHSLRVAGSAEDSAVRLGFITPTIGPFRPREGQYGRNSAAVEDLLRQMGESAAYWRGH